MKTGSSRRYRRQPRRKVTDHPFAGTLQKTQIWLNDLATELSWQSRPHKTYFALRTVLHVLRDRLTIEEAVQLGAQLPMLVRGLYYEGWTLKKKPRKDRHKEDFLAHIKDAFKDEVTIRPESIARAVFKVLAHHASEGEINDVKHILPKSLQELWPAQKVPALANRRLLQMQ